VSWRQPYGAPSLQSTPHLVRRADSPETDPEMRRLAQEIITDQQSEDERLRILTFLHGIRDGD
jgi:hypothetical protein